MFFHTLQPVPYESPPVRYRTSHRPPFRFIDLSLAGRSIVRLHGFSVRHDTAEQTTLPLRSVSDDVIQKPLIHLTSCDSPTIRHINSCPRFLQFINAFPSLASPRSATKHLMLDLSLSMAVIRRQDEYTVNTAYLGSVSRVSERKK